MLNLSLIEPSKHRPLYNHFVREPFFSEEQKVESRLPIMFSPMDSMQDSTCINSSAPCPIELPVSLPLSINCGAELWPGALSHCFFQGRAKNTKYTWRSTTVHSLLFKSKIDVQSSVQHYIRPWWQVILCHGNVRKWEVHGCLPRTCTSTTDGENIHRKDPSRTQRCHKYLTLTPT